MTSPVGGQDPAEVTPPAATLEALLTPRGSEREIMIPGVGTVRIRALTRTEALRVKGREMPLDEAERILISTAMVRPRVTEQQARQWQENSPAGELEPLTKAIAELSGMRVGAAKEAMRRFPGSS